MVLREATQLGRFDLGAGWWCADDHMRERVEGQGSECRRVDDTPGHGGVWAVLALSNMLGHGP